MSKQTVRVDEAARLTLPPKAVKALGLQPGDEVDVEVVGRAVVVRSVEDAVRAGEFAKSGSRGLRDEGALESALAAAENRHHYDQADIATYAYHISQAHAFMDGNKRIAAAIAETFLDVNGAKLDLANDEIVELFLIIAAGRLNCDEVDEIFRASVRT